MKISEMPILTELNADTYVPVVDLTEADPKQQNKRANKSVFRGPQGIQGEQGEDGPRGVDGLSAYQVAVNAGFEGTIEAWLVSLKGEKGEPGTPGADGSDGKDGAPGLSAYEVATANGFIGTESEWLASLRPETVIINDMGEALDGDSNYVVTMEDHQAILGDSTGDLNLVLLNAANVTDSIELHFQPITILTPTIQPTEPHPGITLKGDLVDAFIQVEEGKVFTGIHLPTDATLTVTITEGAITALRITGDYQLLIS